MDRNNENNRFFSRQKRGQKSETIRGQKLKRGQRSEAKNEVRGQVLERGQRSEVKKRSEVRS